MGPRPQRKSVEPAAYLITPWAPRLGSHGVGAVVMWIHGPDPAKGVTGLRLPD